MPVPKPKKPVQSAQKPATKSGSNLTPVKIAVAAEAKAPVKKSESRVKTVPASKPTVRMTALQMQEAADALLKADQAVKKKPGRPPKAATEAEDSSKAAIKRGRKPKVAADSGGGDDTDLSDIEADLVGEEPVAAPIMRFADEMARRKAAVGQVVKKHFIGHQAGNGHHFPAGVLAQHF